MITRLIQVGTKLDLLWYADEPQRRSAASKMQADSQMLLALQGQVTPT